MKSMIDGGINDTLTYKYRITCLLADSLSAIFEGEKNPMQTSLIYILLID